MKKTRIAALADLHIGKIEIDWNTIFREISEQADILVLCGDLTDHGTIEQCHVLIKHLSNCTIPVVGVLGNHDYENGEEETIKHIMKETGYSILDGESVIIHDIGFAGIKGFAGGFDTYTLAAWGEKTIKDFVKESMNESLKLEKALSELSTEKKVGLLHYSPISQTVEGEPKELYPFLGCTRLVYPLEREKVNTIFHGHAHHGTYSGKTQQGIPVYNVSLSILQKRIEKTPYTIIEL